VTPGGFWGGTEPFRELGTDDLHGIKVQLQVYISDVIPGFTIGKKKFARKKIFE